MNADVIEIHPEELFDLRERRDHGLTPRQRARLDQHLAVCAVCEIEARLRADFASELDPPHPRCLR